MKTVNHLPESLTGRCTIHVNDRDEDVTFRTVVLLILGLQENSVDVLDCMIHLWYSAFLKPGHIMTIERLVNPVVADVVKKTQNKADDLLLAKTIPIVKCSVRVVLRRFQWLKLLQMLTRKLDDQDATAQRNYVVLHRVDHIDRNLCAKDASKRVPCFKFRTTGILLPFGASSDGFNIPNP